MEDIKFYVPKAEGPVNRDEKIYLPCACQYMRQGVCRHPAVALVVWQRETDSLLYSGPVICCGSIQVCDKHYHELFGNAEVRRQKNIVFEMALVPKRKIRGEVVGTTTFFSED